MLDFTLADLYEVETRTLNQAVKRNMDRFPSDFMFKLTMAEWKGLPGFSDGNLVTRRPKTSIPYAFTEHGTTMLASVLKSTKAIEMNIAIIRSFISVREFLNSNRSILDQLTDLKNRLGEHDTQLSQIYDVIEQLLEEKSQQKNWEGRERIGYKP